MEGFFKESEPKIKRLNFRPRRLDVQETNQSFQSLDENVENVRKPGEMKLAEGIKAAEKLSDVIHTYFGKHTQDIANIVGLEEHRNFKVFIEHLKEFDQYHRVANLYLQGNKGTIDGLSQRSDQLEVLITKLSEGFSPLKEAIDTRVGSSQYFRVALGRDGR